MNNSYELHKMCVFEMSLLFNQKVDNKKIEAYSNMLKSYSVAQITMAFTNIIKNGAYFFPSCSKVIAEINPSEDIEDLAQRMVDNIISTSILHGRYNQSRIIAELTDLEAKALTLIGGCMQILNSSNSDMPIVKAQLRRTCKSVLSGNKIEFAKIVMNKLGTVNDIDFVTGKTAPTIIDEYAEKLKDFESKKAIALSSIRKIE